MYCVLFVTAFLIGLSVIWGTGGPFFIILLVLLVLYICQANFFRKYVTLFTMYYMDGQIMGNLLYPLEADRANLSFMLQS
jgi:hypothetical protein